MLYACHPLMDDPPATQLGNEVQQTRVLGIVSHSESCHHATVQHTEAPRTLWPSQPSNLSLPQLLFDTSLDK